MVVRFTVRANKAEIIKYADNSKQRAKLATKRRPAVKIIQTTRTITRALLKKRRHLDVLYLTADPIKNNPLRVMSKTKSNAPNFGTT